MGSQKNLDFTILLVCDDESLKKEITALLQESFIQQINIAIQSAVDDTQALELFNQGKKDVVIKYVRKYQSGDLDLFSDIRALDLEVSLVTMYAMPKIELFTKSVELNIERSFPTPLNEEQFVNIILTLCNKKMTEYMLYDQIAMLDDYEKILDANFLVSKTDLKGKITHANENFCRFSGYSEEELVGSAHSIVRHPNEPKEKFKELWETILNKRVWSGEIENMTKEGDRYIVEAVISPILDANGNIKEFIAIRQIITPLIETLEKLEVKEREEIELKRKHSKQLAKAKDEFLVVFTHELKTPLNAIINMSKSASSRLAKIDSPRVASIQEMMSIITNNGDDMLSTITNILDISRLKSHKLDFKREKFCIGDIIDNLIVKFEGLIKESDVILDVDYTHLHTNVELDRQRVMQIISNLISNAIKYSHKKIFISSEVIEKKLHLTIEDNGEGIKDKVKIFELYQQEDDGAMKRASKGTGVGLNFVKLLCEGMGIGLRLEDSQQHGGAKFVLELPLHETINNKEIA